MAFFPLFVDLRGKKCLVAGGGAVAERKVQTLACFEADVIVVSPTLSDKLKELFEMGEITHLAREFQDEDVAGAVLVIAATDNAEVNGRVADRASERGIPVNVADHAEKCTFTFPAVVKQDELVVGISTSGSFPALSHMLRKRIEGLFPKQTYNITEMLSVCRSRAKRELKTEIFRKKLVYRILEEVIFLSGQDQDSKKFLTEEQVIVKIEKIFGEVKNEENNSCRQS